VVKVNAKIRKDIGKAELNAFMSRLKALGSKEHGVAIGITEATGNVPHEGSENTILHDAEINEYGLNGIPQRSFIRGWFDTFEATARGQIYAILTNGIKRGSAVSEMLERMGNRFQGECQLNISQGGDPPFQENSRGTILKKGSSKPLIWHGNLRSAITYLVDPKTGKAA
jgi:hypothetical protein